MKLRKNTITTLAREGRISLQVPQFILCFGKEPEESLIDFPNEWFVIAKSSRVPAVGKKEGGFMFLSEVGWKANKKAIKRAFEKSKHKRGTWEDFEIHAEKHFQDVKDALDKRINYLQRKLEEAKVVKDQLQLGKGNIT